MFKFTEPSTEWFLVKHEREVSIDQDIIQNLNFQDIIAINFLYQNIKNNCKGSVLNEEDGFNVQAQVSTFFKLIFKQLSNPTENCFLVLVITPGYLMQKWSDYLKKIGKLEVLIVGPKTCPKDFDKKNGLALLLSFDDFKLAETLIDYNFISIVIDHFDVVANKLIIKKFTSDFNIGLTQRNFYTDPDQKLQWTILNWVHPGAVGRLIDFYEADDDNFANLRDNYHHWWLTLTWHYCENFKKPKYDEEELKINEQVKIKRKYSARKKRVLKKAKSDSSNENEDDTNNMSEINKDEVKSNNPTTSKQVKPTEKDSVENRENTNSNSSQDTIEYNFDTDNSSAFFKDANSFSKLDEDDHVLLDIIQRDTVESVYTTSDHQSEVDLKKRELYSQIFNNDIPESQSQASESSDDFLLSLIT